MNEKGTVKLKNHLKELKEHVLLFRVGTEIVQRQDDGVL